MKGLGGGRVDNSNECQHAFLPGFYCVPPSVAQTKAEDNEGKVAARVAAPAYAASAPAATQAADAATLLELRALIAELAAGEALLRQAEAAVAQ